MPTDRVFNPRINVLCPSMVTPKASNSGTPSANKAMSVVVPPMSRAIASLAQPVVVMIPIMLAAGPERIV